MSSKIDKQMFWNRLTSTGKQDPVQMKPSLYALLSLTIYFYDLKGCFWCFNLFQVCSNATAANMVAQFSNKTNNCRYKVDSTEETPRENRIKLLTSEDSDEALD